MTSESGEQPEHPRLERCDSYEDQLRSLFISCDEEDVESLNRVQLRNLCGKLELGSDQSRVLIEQLLRADETKWRRDERVTFEVFKEGLVLFLERLSAAEDEHEEVEEQTMAAAAAASKRPESPPREVEPKFVFGDRRYGRRSRPGSVDLPDRDEDQEEEKKVRKLIYKRASHAARHKNSTPYIF